MNEINIDLEGDEPIQQTRKLLKLALGGKGKGKALNRYRRIPLKAETQPANFKQISGNLYQIGDKVVESFKGPFGDNILPDHENKINYILPKSFKEKIKEGVKSSIIAGKTVGQEAIVLARERKGLTASLLAAGAVVTYSFDILKNFLSNGITNLISNTGAIKNSILGIKNTLSTYNEVKKITDDLGYTGKQAEDIKNTIETCLASAECILDIAEGKNVKENLSTIAEKMADVLPKYVTTSDETKQHLKDLSKDIINYSFDKQPELSNKYLKTIFKILDIISEKIEEGPRIEPRIINTDYFKIYAKKNILQPAPEHNKDIPNNSLAVLDPQEIVNRISRKPKGYSNILNKRRSNAASEINQRDRT